MNILCVFGIHKWFNWRVRGNRYRLCKRTDCGKWQMMEFYSNRTPEGKQEWVSYPKSCNCGDINEE